MKDNTKEKPRMIFRLLEGAFMILFHTIKALSRILPPSVLYLIPKAMGAAIFYARPGMRRRLKARISDAIPEITDPRELDRIGREVCSNVFVPLFDIFTLARHGDRYMSNLRIEGIEQLEAVEAGCDGLIFASAHVGAITIIHAVMARLGRPYTPILFNPKDTVMPRYVEILEFYGGFLGCDVEEPAFFAGNDVIPKVRKHLAAGKSLGLTFDVGGNFVVDFFGHPAAMASGVAHFAYDTGAPIVTFSLQRGKNPLDNTLKFTKVIRCDPNANRQSEVARLMSEVVDFGEEIIRDVPGQWISWFGLWQWWDSARDLMEKRTPRVSAT